MKPAPPEAAAGAGSGLVWLGAGRAQGRRDTRMKCLGKAATERSQHQHGAESAWEQQPGTGGHPGRMETPQHPERRQGGKRGDRCCSGARATHSSHRAKRTTCSRTARGGSAHHQNPQIKHQKRENLPMWSCSPPLHHPTIKPPPGSQCSPLRTRGPHSLPAAPPAPPPPRDTN